MATPSVTLTSPSAISARRLVESILRFKDEGVHIVSYYYEWSDAHQDHVFCTKIAGPYEALAQAAEHYTAIEKFATTCRIRLTDRCE